MLFIKVTTADDETVFINCENITSFQNVCSDSRYLRINLNDQTHFNVKRPTNISFKLLKPQNVGFYGLNGFDPR